MVDLANLDALYDSVEAAPDFTPLPDGIYAARIDRAEVKESSQKKTPMLALDMIVVNGEREGQHAFFNMYFTGEKENAEYNKRDLLKLGYVGQVSQLARSLDDFLDKVFEIQVKTKSNRVTNEPQTNIYLRKMIDMGDGAGGVAGAGAPAANFAPAGNKGKSKAAQPVVPPMEAEDLNF